MFQAKVVDATELGNNRYALGTGKEWGLLLDNKTDKTVEVTVTINGKKVPTSWTAGPNDYKTIEKPGALRNYFTFKAPTKAGTSIYTRVMVRATDINDGSIVGHCNITLVDQYDKQATGLNMFHSV